MFRGLFTSWIASIQNHKTLGEIVVKRGYKICAGLVVVAMVAAVVAMLAFIDPLAKAAIEGLGSKITGTKVTLAQADIKPLTGTGTLRGLRMGNP